MKRGSGSSKRHVDCGFRGNILQVAGQLWLDKAYVSQVYPPGTARQGRLRNSKGQTTLWQHKDFEGRTYFLYDRLPSHPQLPTRAKLSRLAAALKTETEAASKIDSKEASSDEPSGGFEEAFEQTVQDNISPEDLRYYQYEAEPHLSPERAHQMATKRALFVTLKQWLQGNRHTCYDIEKDELLEVSREVSKNLLDKDVFWKPKHKLYYQLSRFPDEPTAQRQVLMGRRYGNSNASK